MNFWQMWKKCRALTRGPYSVEGGSGMNRVTTVNWFGETKFEIHKPVKSVSNMVRSVCYIIPLNSNRFQRNSICCNVRATSTCHHFARHVKQCFWYRFHFFKKKKLSNYIYCNVSAKIKGKGSINGYDNEITARRLTIPQFHDVFIGVLKFQQAIPQFFPFFYK